MPSWWNHVVVVMGFSVSSPVVIVGLLPRCCRIRLSALSCYGGAGGVVDVSVGGMGRGNGENEPMEPLPSLSSFVGKPRSPS